jgi:hypothetical protein
VLLGQVLGHHQPVQLPHVARRHHLLEHALARPAATMAVACACAFSSGGGRLSSAAALQCKRQGHLDGSTGY